MKIDLMFSPKQKDQLKPQIEARTSRIIEHGQFIMGPEVKEIERDLAKYCSAKHAIACGNGTDALTLALMAKCVKPGDVIFTPTFTFVATAETISILGATPYFVDVKAGEFNMDPASLEAGIEQAKKDGLNIKGIVTVDVFGQPADYESIQKIADEHNLFVIADAAQSFGASLNGKKVGALAEITTTSFFPTKPLGCYGDGGMIFTDSDEIADTIKSLASHGKGDNKYHNIRVGMNSRLDTIQAAVLLEKIKIFDEEIKKRQQIANYYNKQLEELLKTPKVDKNSTSVWAVYSLLHPNRDEIIEKLKEQNIPSNVYYRIPLHKQPAYENCPKTSMDIAEKISGEAFCLPMHAYLSDKELKYITNSLKNILPLIKNNTA